MLGHNSAKPIRKPQRTHKHTNTQVQENEITIAITDQVGFSADLTN